MKTVSEMTNKELSAYGSEIETQISSLKKEREKVQLELSCRANNVKLNEEFQFEGKTYKIVSFNYSWPQAVWKTKEGGWSKNVKHCYGLRDWKAGKHDNPFTSKPFYL